jgi:hypothetical protein
MSEMPNVESAPVACCLWLLAGVAGASVAATTLRQLFETDPAGLGAVALILAGGAVAAASWRRAHIVLQRRERPRTKDAATRSVPSARVPYEDSEGAGAAKIRPYSVATGSNR